MAQCAYCAAYDKQGKNTYEYFKGSLRDLKYEAEEQAEALEEDLRKEQESENYEMNYQYERSVV